MSSCGRWGPCAGWGAQLLASSRRARGGGASRFGTGQEQGAEAPCGHPRRSVGEQVPEFEALPLEGVPFWDETVLYHRPTQTLLGADIVCSAGSKDHWTWRCGARLTGCYGRVRVPPDARKKIPDKSAAARSLGDIVEEGCVDHLARAWRLEGVEV